MLAKLHLQEFPFRRQGKKAKMLPRNKKDSLLDHLPSAVECVGSGVRCPEVHPLSSFTTCKVKAMILTMDLTSLDLVSSTVEESW